MKNNNKLKIFNLHYGISFEDAQPRDLVNSFGEEIIAHVNKDYLYTLELMDSCLCHKTRPLKDYTLTSIHPTREDFVNSSDYKLASQINIK